MVSTAKLSRMLNDAMRVERSLSVKFSKEFSRGFKDRYKREWITIGGQKSGDEEHAGGQAVEITETGQITKGPDAIEGADVGSLGTPDWFDDVSGEDRAAKWDNATEQDVQSALDSGKPVPSRVLSRFPKQAAAKRNEGLKAQRDSKNKVKSDLRAKRINEARARKGLPSIEGEGDASDSAETGPVGAPPTEPGDTVDAPPSAPPWFRGARAEPEAIPEPETDPEQKYKGVVRNPDGNYVGAAQVSLDDLAVDPHRFQYKVTDIDSATGVTKELKEVKRFRPEFAGQLLVWNDPETDQAYVVNGHHRYELAKRAGYQDDLSVFFLDAKTDVEARSIGALANMAEGRGSPVDAAKFMRDNNKTADDLRDEGISLKGKIAEHGTILAGLNDAIFHQVAIQRMKVSRGLAIGRELTDHGDQSKLMDYLNKAESGGKRISDTIVGEMARELHQAPRRTSETQSTLFGETGGDEESLFLERNLLKSALRAKLTDSARAFKSVSSGTRQDILEQGGRNLIDAESNKQAAADSRLDLHDYDREVNLRGPLSTAVNESARELADDPKSKTTIVGRLHERIQRILSGAENDFNPGAMGSNNRESQRDAGAWTSGDDERRLTPAAGQTAMAFSRLADDINRAFVDRYRRHN